MPTAGEEVLQQVPHSSNIPNACKRRGNETEKGDGPERDHAHAPVLERRDQARADLNRVEPRGLGVRTRQYTLTQRKRIKLAHSMQRFRCTHGYVTYLWRYE